MRRAWHLSMLALLLAGHPGFAPLASRTPAPLAQVQDYAALIGTFPRPGSDGAKADLAILLWLQRSRTLADVRRAETEVSLHLGIFSQVTGRDLASGPFPLTRALADELGIAWGRVIGPLKQKAARPRPYVAFREIKPALPLEPSTAFPSGHASWAMAQATLLAALEPDRREAILERGRLMGYDRVLGGVHYPSDVEAGQMLGTALAEAWLAGPAVQRRLAAARAEW